jgi:DNA replicative helicase MCM subunit Mcm2 (Cdc46/Mcm family)
MIGVSIFNMEKTAERIINFLLDQLEQRDRAIEYYVSDRRTKPKAEISKLKVFIDTFNTIANGDHNEVEEKDLIYKLVATGTFTEDESYDYLKRALQNGQIYERKAGYYVKT